MPSRRAHPISNPLPNGASTWNGPSIAEAGYALQHQPANMRAVTQGSWPVGFDSLNNGNGGSGPSKLTAKYGEWPSARRESLLSEKFRSQAAHVPNVPMSTPFFTNMPVAGAPPSLSPKPGAGRNCRNSPGGKPCRYVLNGKQLCGHEMLAQAHSHAGNGKSGAAACAQRHSALPCSPSSLASSASSVGAMSSSAEAKWRAKFG